MKTIYIKETRNEDDVFYRSGDWGMNKPDDWDNGRDNWTTKKPPEESLREENPIPCDWNESLGEWELDQSALDQERIEEIDERLREIDLESIRPTRSIENGTDTQYDHDRLAELESEAEQLREERRNLAG